MHELIKVSPSLEIPNPSAETLNNLTWEELPASEKHEAGVDISRFLVRNITFLSAHKSDLDAMVLASLDEVKKHQTVQVKTISKASSDSPETKSVRKVNFFGPVKTALPDPATGKLVVVEFDGVIADVAKLRKLDFRSGYEIKESPALGMIYSIHLLDGTYQQVGKNEAPAVTGEQSAKPPEAPVSEPVSEKPPELEPTLAKQEPPVESTPHIVLPETTAESTPVTATPEVSPIENDPEVVETYEGEAYDNVVRGFMQHTLSFEIAELEKETPDFDINVEGPELIKELRFQLESTWSRENWTPEQRITEFLFKAKEKSLLSAHWAALLLLNPDALQKRGVKLDKLGEHPLKPIVEVVSDFRVRLRFEVVDGHLRKLLVASGFGEPSKSKAESSASEEVLSTTLVVDSEIVAAVTPDQPKSAETDALRENVEKSRQVPIYHFTLNSMGEIVTNSTDPTPHVLRNLRSHEGRASLREFSEVDEFGQGKKETEKTKIILIGEKVDLKSGKLPSEFAIYDVAPNPLNANERVILNKNEVKLAEDETLVEVEISAQWGHRRRIQVDSLNKDRPDLILARQTVVPREVKMIAGGLAEGAVGEVVLMRLKHGDSFLLPDQESIAKLGSGRPKTEYEAYAKSDGVSRMVFLHNPNTAPTFMKMSEDQYKQFAARSLNK